jgi:hypothetical protein
MLHFTNLAFPAGERLEVDLRYETETFTAASGPDAWTRPIDPKPGPIRIRYYGSGPAGGVTLAEYGSGEPTQTGTPGDLYGSLTDVDLFLHTNPYVEPIYETRLKCGTFDWNNAACAAPASVAQQVGSAVCCFVHVHRHGTDLVVSTCSATLIDNNFVLTASHCATETDDLEVRSGSVVFGYQTNCNGSRPIAYAPKIHKVTRIVRRGSWDWLTIEIATPPGGVGITPAVLRPSEAVAGETVTAIHHPHGAVKKFQTATLATGGVNPVVGFDYAGGSSGSALFDSAGQIVGGALSAGPLGGDACQVAYTPATTILQELANPPAPPAPFDVMLVMDRSGSMSDPGIVPGRTKMQEARDAASLFVRLLRTNAGDHIGLVSFSTAATTPLDSALGNVTQGKKNQLVGQNSPYTGGIIGGLNPGGATSIGGGLSAATGALAPGSNQRAILLMTDGLQNTPPMIEDVEAALGSIRLVAIGFGAESDLDSALLSRVARSHAGLYTRANDGLELKKFFSLAFGNIFETGALADPEVVFDADEEEPREGSFAVCEEERITAILGWDDPSQNLALDLETPAGVLVSSPVAGVDIDRGATWQFIRVALPLDGEAAGTWRWRVRRLGGGELAPSPQRVHAFVNVIAQGGPRLDTAGPMKRTYTGDAVVPLVSLRYENGTAPHARVILDVEAPDEAVGKVVADAGLAEVAAGDDPVSAFRSTLRALGEGQPYRTRTRTESVELFDDGEHLDGAMEPDGTYGNLLEDLTRYEGTYRFHARAEIEEPCPAERETQWAIHVELGIDPNTTTVTLSENGPGSGGHRDGTLVVTPRDRYGSPLGPGRSDQIPVTGGTGTMVGTPADNGDGSYSVPVSWDPDSVDDPSVIISQPDRPPVVLHPGERHGGKRRCPAWCWLLAFVVGIAVGIVVVARRRRRR